MTGPAPGFRSALRPRYTSGMQLNIRSESGPLTDLCVCRGDSIPEAEGYENDHPEFAKYVHTGWDRDLFVRQQDRFFAEMEARGVRLHHVPADPALPWQTYTRDTGFVVGGRLFHYEGERRLPERTGEIDRVKQALDLPAGAFVPITDGTIEGGDVLVGEGEVWVGISARTSAAGAAELARHLAGEVEVRPLQLGEQVMHLDTRMTILPGRRALIHTPTFAPDDLARLAERFTLIPVTDAEAESLGPNVFVVDPETVIVHEGHARIADEIAATGLTPVRVDYSEPVALRGSFRCSTMPLARG